MSRVDVTGLWFLMINIEKHYEVTYIDLLVGCVVIARVTDQRDQGVGRLHTLSFTC